MLPEKPLGQGRRLRQQGSQPWLNRASGFKEAEVSLSRCQPEEESTKTEAIVRRCIYSPFIYNKSATVFPYFPSHSRE
jgi:hypothetical protein